MKKIVVDISETLSSTKVITVEDDFDETNEVELKQRVLDEVVLPRDTLEYENYIDWIVDDFCVTIL